MQKFGSNVRLKLSLVSVLVVLDSAFQASVGVSGDGPPPPLESRTCRYVYRSDKEYNNGLPERSFNFPLVTRVYLDIGLVSPSNGVLRVEDPGGNVALNLSGH